LSQLYGPFGANTTLIPETNTTIEGGLEFRPSNKFRLSAVYFNRVEEDRISYVTIDPETFESQYRNLPDKVAFNGFELELRAMLVKNMEVTANYTYTGAKNGLALRIPNNKLNGALGYSITQKTYASVAVQYVSERTDTDFTTFSILDLQPLTLVDMYIKHKVSSKFNLFASVSNILNEDYQELVDYTTLGRNIRVGFTLSL